MTGGGQNEAREVEDEDLILSAMKEAFTSVTDRVSQMLLSALAN